MVAVLQLGFETASKQSPGRVTVEQIIPFSSAMKAEPPAPPSAPLQV